MTNRPQTAGGKRPRRRLVSRDVIVALVLTVIAVATIGVAWMRSHSPKSHAVNTTTEVVQN